MRRSRKPLSVVRRIEGSNPSPSAFTDAIAIAVSELFQTPISAPLDVHDPTADAPYDGPTGRLPSLGRYGRQHATTCE
jgi:hypothetical protein